MNQWLKDNGKLSGQYVSFPKEEGHGSQRICPTMPYWYHTMVTTQNLCVSSPHITSKMVTTPNPTQGIEFKPLEHVGFDIREWYVSMRSCIKKVMSFIETSQSSWSWSCEIVLTLIESTNHRPSAPSFDEGQRCSLHRSTRQLTAEARK